MGYTQYARFSLFYPGGHAGGLEQHGQAAADHQEEGRVMEK